MLNINIKIMDVEKFKGQFSYIPLGLRLNNIGCIRYNERNNWNGQIGKYRGFARFSAFEYGVRALTIVLMGYLNKYSLFDIRHLLQKYAPSEDGNFPHLYAHFVTSMSGLYTISREISLIRIQLPMIVYYISCIENGSEYIKFSRSEDYRQYLFDLVRKYIDEYLEQVVYPSKGKILKF